MRKRYYDEWVVSEEELKHMWVTSDTHFGHEFIRTCCFRPFDSVEEMDKAIRKQQEAYRDNFEAEYNEDFDFSRFKPTD